YEDAILVMSNPFDHMRRSAIKLCSAALNNAPYNTTLLIFSSGSPGTSLERSALNPAVVIRTAPAIIRSRPATRLASYQILSFDNVFGTRKPDQRLRGIHPRRSGTPAKTKARPAMK